eukprot:scaffold1013_cov33-Prasinocladus_malaysianus.AAC.1
MYVYLHASCVKGGQCSLGDLTDNDIKDEGAAALAEVLPLCRSLEQLNLKSEGHAHGFNTKQLQEAMSRRLRIVFADLCTENEIGPEGSSALAEALPQTTSLHHL